MQLYREVDAEVEDIWYSLTKQVGKPKNPEKGFLTAFGKKSRECEPRTQVNNTESFSHNTDKHSS